MKDLGFRNTSEVMEYHSLNTDVSLFEPSLNFIPVHIVLRNGLNESERSKKARYERNTLNISLVEKIVECLKLMCV